MLEFLARYPRINGFFLGILQGIPQGLAILDQDPQVLSALSILDDFLVFMICFGFFTPLVSFLIIVAIRGAKRTKIWTVLSRYVNLYDMMFWTCLSLSVAGLYALDRAGTDVGYAMCALFAACGISMLVIGYLETRLQNKKIDKAV
jgi:hypothetical protein